jgi:hypothetical protein
LPVPDNAAELARRAAERERLEAALRTARGDLGARVREVQAIEQQLEAARKAVTGEREIVEDLERRLAELNDPGS